MNKSILSTDKIQIDLYKILKSEKRHTFGICMLYMWIFLGLSIASCLIGAVLNSFWVGLLLFLATFIVTAINVFRRTSRFAFLKKQIGNEEFFISTEVLIDIGETEEYVPHPAWVAIDRDEPRESLMHTHSQKRKVDLLNFPSGSWPIPESLYEWSRENKMSYADIRDTSEVGDEFYVVIYNKSKKIGCAYNKKFFHLAEHPKHEEKNEEEFSSLNSAELERDVIEDKIKLDESKIKIDLKQHANYAWIFFEEYSFWVTFFSFIVGVLIAVPTKNAWMLLILPAAPMVCSLYVFTVWIIRRYNIKKGKFVVHTGTFERNKRKDVFFPVLRTRVYEESYTEHCTETYYFLIFNFGKWLIPDNTLYLWSEESKMTMDALKFSTEKDDEFYIVTYGKSKKIGYVYNKNLFELDDHLIHDEKPE